MSSYFQTSEGWQIKTFMHNSQMRPNSAIEMELNLLKLQLWVTLHYIENNCDCDLQLVIKLHEGVTLPWVYILSVWYHRDLMLYSVAWQALAAPVNETSAIIIINFTNLNQNAQQSLFIRIVVIKIEIRIGSLRLFIVQYV